MGLLFFANVAFAQPTSNDIPNYETKKVTLSSGMEGSLLQFAKVTSGSLRYTTIPRYSYFFNMGVDINFHLQKNIAPYTGFQIKNIGHILKLTDSTRKKERVYTIGAPLGLKLYFDDRKFTVRAGADIALAFNYKSKYFVNGEKITKSNEFFSDQASLLFASVFAGFSYSGLTLSGNYYLTNFFHPSNIGAKGTLFTISLGIHLDENIIRVEKEDSDSKTAFK